MFGTESFSGMKLSPGGSCMFLTGPAHVDNPTLQRFFPFCGLNRSTLFASIIDTPTRAHTATPSCSSLFLSLSHTLLSMTNVFVFIVYRFECYRGRSNIDILLSKRNKQKDDVLHNRISSVSCVS